MEALDLIILGKQLTRLGEQALRDANPSGNGASSTSLPTGTLIVIRDVLDHPGTSIIDIVARTGLPQSYASDCVSKLRIKGLAEISTDPADRRRTLVRLRTGEAEAVARGCAQPVDDLLRTAVGGRKGSDRLITALVSLADRLRAARVDDGPAAASTAAPARARRPRQHSVPALLAR